MNRQSSRKLLGHNEVVFSIGGGQGSRYDREAFRRMVALAAESGATHIFVGQVDFRYDNWVLPDNSDPYAAWSNTQGNFFRVCPPKVLQPWVNLDHAHKLQDALREKLDIIRPYGLKGTSFAVEPHWLPEGVYRAYPSWRGPQCELGRIARRPYFAPNIDNPKVLDLYREAVKEYVTLFPEIDQFHFLLNDSGSGLCWSPNIYPGMNGPTDSRTRDQGERIAAWLNSLQEGAIAGGHAMRLHASSCGLVTETVNAARLRLLPGCYVRDMDKESRHFNYAGAGLAEGIWSATWPVPGMGDAEGFLGGLENVYVADDKQGARAEISIGNESLDLGEILLNTYLADPGKGFLHRQKLLLKAAATVAGNPESAEALVGAWRNVSKALHTIGQVRQKGFCAVLPFGGVSMRWIIRPLVAQPEALTPAEKEYYTRHLFSNKKDGADTNFGVVLGKGVFRGESVMWLVRWCLVDALGLLKAACGTVAGLVKKTTDAAAGKRLQLYAARIGALACCTTTIKNCIMFQYALDIRKQPQFGPNQMDYDDNIIYDLRGVNQRKIAREELDNTANLITIIETHPGLRILDVAQCPEEENVFMLSPDIVGDLRRKMDIMLDHWPDFENLYPATKMYDFEPDAPANT